MKPEILPAIPEILPAAEIPEIFPALPEMLPANAAVDIAKVKSDAQRID